MITATSIWITSPQGSGGKKKEVKRGPTKKQKTKLKKPTKKNKIKKKKIK